jgi:tetratricopeptide (TPR) repeat protein
VATAREYLAKLVAEAGRDRGLRRDLAESYYRLGGIERRLGDVKAATAHFKNSMAILEASGDHCCGPAAQRKLYIEDLNMLTSMELDGAALTQAMQDALHATEAARKWTRSVAADPAARKALLNSLDRQGQVLEAAGKHPEAKQVLEEGVTVADALRREQPADIQVAEDAADTRKDLALTLEEMGEGVAALTRVREGEAILDVLIASAPENKGWRQSRIELTSTRSRLIGATARGDAKIMDEAVAVQKEASTMALAAAAANPRDLEVLDMAAVMMARLANRLVGAKRVEESVAAQREAITLIDQMLAITPDSRRYLYLRANAGMLAGNNLGRAERWREAREALLEGERFSKRALAKSSEDVRVLQTNNSLLILLTRAERNLGNLEQAKERCREAMASAENLIRKNKNAKVPVAMIEILHSEAKLLGVPDTTLLPE